MNFSRILRADAVRTLSVLSSASVLHYALPEQSTDADTHTYTCRPISALSSFASMVTACDSTNEQEEHPQMDTLLQNLLHTDKSVIQSHAVPEELDMTIRFGAFCEEVQGVLTEEEQVELDEEECQGRGKPWNSYHHIANVPK